MNKAKWCALAMMLMPLWLASEAQTNKERALPGTVVDEPWLVHADVPSYPHDARLAHITGTVEVQVTVQEGRVVATVVRHGHPILAKATTENIKTWTFRADVNRQFATKFIYKIAAEKTASARQTNPTIEMHLPAFVVITARPILLEDSDERRKSPKK